MRKCLQVLPLMAWFLAASGGAWAQEITLTEVDAKAKDAKNKADVADTKTTGLAHVVNLLVGQVAGIDTQVASLVAQGGGVADLTARVAELEAFVAYYGPKYVLLMEGANDVVERVMALETANTTLKDTVKTLEGKLLLAEARIKTLEDNAGGGGGDLTQLQADVETLMGRTCSLELFGVCNETCMDYSANDQNCGSCGNVCGYHEGCYQGACVPASSLGWNFNGYFEGNCKFFESISMVEWERACYDDNEWWPPYLAAYRTVAVDVLQAQSYGCPEGQFSTWWVDCWKVGAGDWATVASAYFGF